MADQGQVKIILGVDTQKAQQDIDTFFTKLKTQKVDDPFKDLGKGLKTQIENLSKIGVESKKAQTSITGLGDSAKKAGVSIATLGSKGVPGLKVVGATAENLGVQFKATQASVDLFSKKIKGLQGATAPAANSIKTLSQSIAASQAPTQASGAALGTLSTKIKQLSSSGNTFKGVSTNLNQLAKASAAPIGPLEKLKRKLQEVGKTGKASTGTVANGFKTMAQGIPTGIGFAIGNAILAPLRELGNVAPQAVEEFTKLDGSIRLTLGIAGEASSKFGQLQDAILTVGASTAATTIEVAEVAQSLARAGQSLEEIEQSLDPIVRGAEATGTTYGDMGNIVVAALGQFRLEAADTADVVDTLTVAANSSNQTVSDLGEALKYVGPVAAGAGQTLQNVSIALEILANNGIKASSAGTSLRTILTNLQIASAGAGEEFTSLSRGSTRLSKAMRLIGAEVTDANGQLLEMPVLLKSLRDGMSDLDIGERAIISKVLAGSEGLPTLNSLMSATDAQIDELADGMENRMGAAAEAQAKAMAGLFGAVKELNSAMSAALNHIGSVIAKGLEPLLRVTKLVLDAFRALPGPVKDFLVLLGLIGAAAGITAVAMSLLKDTVIATFAASVIGKIQAFTAAFAAANLQTSIAGMVNGIKALATAAKIQLVTSMGAATKAIKAFTAAVKSGAITQGLVGTISAISLGLQGVAAPAAAGTTQLSMFGTAGATAGAGATAAGAGAVSATAGIKALGASLGSLLIVIGPVLIVLGALAAAIRLVTDEHGAYVKSGEKLFAANEKAKASFEKLEKSSENLRKGLKGVGDESEETIKVQEGMLTGLNRWLNPLDNSMEKATAGIRAVKAAARELNGEIDKGNNTIRKNEAAMKGLSSASDQYASLASVNVDVVEEQKKAIESQIAAMESEIAATTKRDNASVRRIRTLQDEKQKLEELLPAVDKKLDRLSKEEARVNKLRGANNEFAKSLASITRAYGERNDSIDASVEQTLLENTVAVAKGLKTEEEAAASNAAVTVKAIDEKIKASEELIKSVKARADKNGENTAKETKQIEGQTKVISQLFKDRVEAEEALKGAVKAAVDARLGDYKREVDAIAAGYEKLGSLVNNLNSINVGGIDAFKSLADAVTNYDLTAAGKVKDERLKNIDTEKSKRLAAIEMQKNAAIRAAGDNDAYRQSAERNYAALRSRTEAEFNSKRSSAEAQYANERKKIVQESIQFQLQAIEATTAVRKLELDIAQRMAMIQNEVAINENLIAIEKAKASGASERELTALQNVGVLLNTNTDLIKLQHSAQTEILGVQEETKLKQLQTKALQEGVNVAIGGTANNLDDVADRMENFKSKIDDATRGVLRIGETFEEIPQEVEEIAGRIKENIQGNLNAVSFDGLYEKFREMGIPPEAAERLVASIDDSLERGGMEGVISAEDAINALEVSDATKEQLWNDIARPMIGGVNEGLAAVEALFAQRMAGIGNLIPKDEISELLRSTFDTGTKAGVAEFDKYMEGLPENIPSSELEERLTDAINEGGKVGEQALVAVLKETKAGETMAKTLEEGSKEGALVGAREIEEQATKAIVNLQPTLGNAVSQGFVDGLGKAQSGLTDFGDVIAGEIMASLEVGTRAGLDQFKVAFAAVIGEALAMFEQFGSAFPVDELKKQIEAGILTPLKEVKDSLENLEASGLADHMKVVEAAFEDVKQQNVPQEMENVKKGAENAARAVDSISTAIRNAKRDAVNLTRELNKAAEAARRASSDRWSGGEVRAGQSYTVNELGQEMFLSNSGRLSDIKAPAFGSWSPPSSGTVIPASTSQAVRENAQALEVNAAISAMPGISGGLAAAGGGDNTSRQLLRAIKGMNSKGMNQTNNIQITSATPSKDASRMTMEMARLRLRRR